MRPNKHKTDSIQKNTKLFKYALGFSVLAHTALLVYQHPKTEILITTAMTATSAPSSLAKTLPVELKNQKLEKEQATEKKVEEKPREEKVVETSKPEQIQEEEKKEKTTKEFSSSTTLEFDETIEDSPAPHYPMMARRRGQEGLVRLKIEIEKNGTPINVNVVESSGYQVLDQAAASAVRRWRFRPVSLASIETYFVEKTIEFRLQ